MAGEYYKCEHFVRGVVNGRVVARRPGARIPMALAIQLGLVEPPPPPAAVGRPSKPAGAKAPRKRTAGRR